MGKQLKYLADTNLFLEILLNQARAEEVKAFFVRVDAEEVAVRGCLGK
ncbi:MAG: hypothetical protein K6U12_09905 [Armatimonadetes bacterium]|nr:hypothetical protein [Armatimonadota bacterium]